MTTRLFVALQPSGECRHLSLSFLGNVEDERVADCADRLATCARRASQFALRTKDLGAFPSPVRPSVVWLGIEAEPAAGLASLQRDLADAYRDIRKDPKPFRPHITMGRVKDMSRVDRTAFAAALTALPESSTRWECRHVTLFESTLSADGAVHAAIQTVPIPS